MRPIVREARRPWGAVLAAAPLLGLAASAAAYEGPMHHALAQAVFAVSPAARSRVPERFLGAVYRGAEDADQPSSSCDLHGGVGGGGGAEAQKLLDYLLRTGEERWSSNRALVLGRLLHLAADATVPDAIARGESNAVLGLFAGRQIALFRERRDPAAPFRDLLALAARETRWADDPSDDDGMRVRAAVNLGIEAVLRLPPAEGRAAGEDGGVAIFVVDRITQGVAAHTRTDPPERSGLLVLEWMSRTTGDETLHRILVFNPTPQCGRELVLHAGEFNWPVSANLPPHSFRRLEVRTPARFNRRLNRVETRASQLCPPGMETAGATAIRGAITVSGTAGSAPDVDSAPLIPY